MNASKHIGAIILVVVLCAWTYIVFTDEPRLQVDIADGVYTNRCCGALVLDKGTMTIANQRIGYVIERDKGGPFVLPKTYVGASGTGFVIKRDAYALKLRLDDSSHPYQVELVDDGPDGGVFPFARKGSNP